MLALGSARTTSIEWHTFVPSLLTRDSHVLDLGANIGRFSTQIVERFNCTCHAIEPDPDLIARIPDHPRIKRYPYAIATQNGSVTLKRGDNSLAASITENAGASGEEFTVRGIDLKSFVDANVQGRISLIKMDIENAEIDILRSLPDSFLSEIPQISVEFHDFIGWTTNDVVVEIANRLESLGFHYIRMSGVGHQDTLFVHRDRASFDWSDALTTKLITRNVRGLKRVVRRRLGLSM
jgi:FkbM family methyltransferase